MKAIFKLIILFSLNTSAQHTISGKDIDIIILKDWYVEFYKKTGDTFSEVYLEDNYESTYNRTSDKVKKKGSVRLEMSTRNSLKKEDIIRKNRKVFYVDDLKKINIKKYLKNQFTYNDTQNTEKKIITLVNPFQISITPIYFGKKKSGDFGWNESSIENTIEKWRVGYSNNYEIVRVNLKKGKTIFLLYSNRMKYKGIFIPCKESNYLDINENLFKLKKVKKNHTSDKGILGRLGFYKLHKIKNKYQFQTLTGDNVLKQSYDTIIFNNHYIIGKSAKKTEIYNKNLKKIKIRGLKAAYLKKRWLEILTKKEAKYIDFKQNKVTSFPEYYSFGCGNVFYESLTIKKDTIINDYGYMWSKNSRYIYLKNIPKIDSISFINTKKEYEYSGNTLKINRIPFNLFRLKYKDKVGLFIGDYKSIKYSKPIRVKTKNEFWEIVNKNPESVEFYPEETQYDYKYKSYGDMCLTKKLPIIYDNIYYKNNIIYLKKGEKKGFLFKNNPKLYDLFKKETKHFYSILKNKKRGFVDVKTGKEYF